MGPRRIQLRWAGHVARMEEGRSAFKILTGKPTDIPEPSLIEVELAIEKLKRHKATGVDHIPSKLIQAGGGKLYEEINKQKSPIVDEIQSELI